MPSSEAIEATIAQAVTAGFRGRMIARGQARAIIWRDGILPPNAPAFEPQLSSDIHGYAYALLGQGIRLREAGGDDAKARVAFEQAATALEAVISKGDPGDVDRDFHFIIAAASYHLAHLAARAYSLLALVRDDGNFSPTERVLASLMRRDFRELLQVVLDHHISGRGRDEGLAETILSGLKQAEQGGAEEGGNPMLFDVLDMALTDRFMAAMAMYTLAIEQGKGALVERAMDQLRTNLGICSEFNLLPQWWAHRIAIHLLNDLWNSTFHQRLPMHSSGGDAEAWPALREMFIAVLHQRQRAEVDLWPSQLEAASRAVDQGDDLVVSLPTSAGKTRIAELCILRALASGKRVIFVTPLRALSAQTEITLQKTFGPLGKTVSALYGSIGVSGVDEDAVRKRDIVVATPEKLDFALRNDPSLLNDVGLLVFDEGHMIGMSEREVRYEAQIQRLLRRADAQERRIVCLSAILPDGDQLDDFAAWLRRDHEGGLIKQDWRPTRLRFGEVTWMPRAEVARLDLRVGEERPFVPQFFAGFVPPVGQRRKIFPSDQRELCLASAWRLVQDGQSVLIFCPRRKSVEPFATVIVDLVRRGALTSLLQADPEVLSTAMALGAEWLGVDSAVLACLKLGVALHHGALPTAYRKEVEKLLRDGVLKVTISSPTLAQGLNLTATAVIMQSLHSSQDLINVADFKNVIGRAGRAYIDIEGLVLHPMFDDPAKRRRDWETLINDLGARDMESGLVQLVGHLLARMWRQVGGDLSQLVEYVANQDQDWTFPELAGELPAVRTQALVEWTRSTALLDTAILSLIGESQVPDEDVSVVLDAALQSSLWSRRLLRQEEVQRQVFETAMEARTHYIWRHSTPASRRGYFLAGVGLATGQALDARAEDLNRLLLEINGNLAIGHGQQAIEAMTSFADIVFAIPPFQPDTLPANWRKILRGWLLGQSVAMFSDQESDTLQFIEATLVYRLPWALEAVRVRAIANAETIDGYPLDTFELGLAVAAVETGTMNRSASLLIQAGFGSRLAAVKAVTEMGAAFDSGPGLREWLRSDEVSALSKRGDWPTQETHEMWVNFIHALTPRDAQVWRQQQYQWQVRWYYEPPSVGEPVRLYAERDKIMILAADGTSIGVSPLIMNPNAKGLANAHTGEDGQLIVNYMGPDNFFAS